MYQYNRKKMKTLKIRISVRNKFKNIQSTDYFLETHFQLMLQGILEYI